MQYFLNDEELDKISNALKVAMSIPFIDSVEDYILEAIWEYTKGIDGIDPFYNIRSKKLFDVVDNRSKTGWSVKSIQWAFYDECEFELVIQRSDVYKNADTLGFPGLDKDHDPNEIGSALLEHWRRKVEGDAIDQEVTSKRMFILLKKENKREYAILEKDIQLYTPDELEWRWTSAAQNGLKGFRRSDDMCVYRWYPSQKQFFERFILPNSSQKLTIQPTRLTKAQVVDILLPYL